MLDHLKALQGLPSFQLLCSQELLCKKSSHLLLHRKTSGPILKLNSNFSFSPYMLLTNHTPILNIVHTFFIVYNL